MAKTKDDHLTRVDCERIAYNKKHGTRYSYGEYTALVRLKKIKPDRKKWWEVES